MKFKKWPISVRLLLLLALYFCLLFVVQNAFHTSRDSVVFSVLVLWSLYSIVAICLSHIFLRHARVRQGIKYGILIVAYLLAMLPIVISLFCLFLVVALQGADFR